MRVLIVRLTSMGDVIHALPAVTDAVNALPNCRFDWVVEGAFSEIPTWHAAVDRVVPVALRRWRKNFWQSRNPIKQAYSELREQQYDLVIDAQGLIKSAVLSRIAKGDVSGFDAHSLREPLASRLYQTQHAVSRQRHAIERVRDLFAESLAYTRPESVADYGIDPVSYTHLTLPTKRIV